MRIKALLILLSSFLFSANGLKFPDINYSILETINDTNWSSNTSKELETFMSDQHLDKKLSFHLRRIYSKKNTNKENHDKYFISQKNYVKSLNDQNIDIKPLSEKYRKSLFDLKYKYGISEEYSYPDQLKNKYDYVITYIKYLEFKKEYYKAFKFYTMFGARIHYLYNISPQDIRSEIDKKYYLLLLKNSFSKNLYNEKQLKEIDELTKYTPDYNGMMTTYENKVYYSYKIHLIDMYSFKKYISVSPAILEYISDNNISKNNFQTFIDNKYNRNIALNRLFTKLTKVKNELILIDNIEDYNKFLKEKKLKMMNMLTESKISNVNSSQFLDVFSELMLWESKFIYIYKYRFDLEKPF